MVKWTPQSELDLDEIREHIASNFNVDLAIETVDELIDHIEKLLDQNPLAGSILESNPLFFKVIYKGNAVFYCENPKDRDIYVVYIRPCGTDLRSDRINAEDVALG